jgi:hypothetical protein
VKAKKSSQKATDWSSIKKESSLKETQRSWYQAIDKKHLCVYVKFDGGLSIPFARKPRSKKSGTFSKGMSAFSQMAGVEKLNLCSMESPNDHCQRRAQYSWLEQCCFHS